MNYKSGFPLGRYMRFFQPVDNQFQVDPSVIFHDQVQPVVLQGNLPDIQDPLIRSQLLDPDFGKL